MDSQLNETLPSNIIEETKQQVEDEVWIDDDEDNMPIDSFYQRSDSEDSIGDTFFPGYGGAEDIPTVKPELYLHTPSWCANEDFCAIEEMKKLLPSAFTEQQIFWWKKVWSAKLDICIPRIYFAAILFIPVIIYFSSGLLAIQFQDRICLFQSRRLQWHTSTEKVRLERPLPMLGVEALYLIPMISAWYAWEMVTVLVPFITAWKPVGWFLRFCLEEFFTAHWCDIIDDIFIESPKYRKYLVQELINQHGKVVTCRLPVDTMFIALLIGRWILDRAVGFKLIVACHVQLLALLIVCWDCVGFILWRWEGDLLSLAMRIATYEFGGISEDETSVVLEVEGD